MVIVRPGVLACFVGYECVMLSALRDRHGFEKHCNSQSKSYRSLLIDVSLRASGNVSLFSVLLYWPGVLYPDVENDAGLVLRSQSLHKDLVRRIYHAGNLLSKRNGRSGPRVLPSCIDVLLAA